MIKITKYTPVDKGALRGFCSIEVAKWCLAINDLSIFESGGRKWLNFPSKKSDPKDGADKPSYFPYIRFTDKETNERFNSAVIAALDEFIRKNNQDVPQATNHNDTLPF